MTLKEETIQRLKTLIVSDRNKKRLLAEYQEANDRHVAIYRRHTEKSWEKVHPDHKKEILERNQKIQSLSDRCQKAVDDHTQIEGEFYKFLSENASEILEINEERNEKKVVKKLGSVKPSKATEMFDKFLKEKDS